MLINFFETMSRHEWHWMKPGLERIYQACERLGHPQMNFRIIHVAGTNGKGSVVAMLHSVLSEAGFKTGRFTSPHLVSVRERFQIGNELISEAELEEILTLLQTRNLFSPALLEDTHNHRTPISSEEPPIVLTFFELCTLIALLYFSRHKVDFAILEVGLGGRLDSTNVVTPLLSVITEIGFDHQEVLGNSLTQIAQEKGGIIKYRTPVVIGTSASEAQQVLIALAKQQDAPYSLTKKARALFGHYFHWESYSHVSMPLLGNHQIQNAEIALTCLEVLQKQGFEIPEFAVRQGFAHVKWPGRLEWISQSPRVLCDGAHNPQGIAALAEFLKTTSLRWKVLFSAVKEKNIIEMLQLLAPQVEKIYFCVMNQSLRSVDPLQLHIPSFLADLTTKLQITATQPFELYSSILKDLKPGEGLLITGSLYLVGEIKKSLPN